MPKTTKTIRKSSVTSGKKLGLKSRFSLRSKKIQFFVVVMIVGILGGGYYVYRSYAAVAQTSTNYSIDQGMFVGSGNGCTASSANTEPSKNNMRIAVLSCPGKNNSKALAKANVNTWSKPAGRYRGCFTAKGGGGISAYINGVRDGLRFTAPVLPSEWSKINSNGYTKVCTQWGTSTVPLDNIVMHISLNDYKPGILAVSFITLERQVDI